MTREERELSIEYLEGIKDNYIEGHGYERYPLPEYYAIENAIKALEQEPVLDKIKDEIETEYGQCDICEYFEDYDYEENDISEYRPIGNIADILQIIDKYKAESESQESEDKE